MRRTKVLLDSITSRRVQDTAVRFRLAALLPNCAARKPAGLINLQVSICHSQTFSSFHLL
jgi:hypothetical protein